MKHVHTVYKNPRTSNIEQVKFKKIFEDIEYLFNKSKKVFVTAPRQSGKSIFLVDIALNRINDYDQIIFTSYKNTGIEELNDRVRFNLEHFNVNKKYSKYTKTDITFINCNMMFRNSLEGIEYKDKKTLILLDEYLFDTKLTQKLKVIEDNISNIDFIGTSVRTPNVTYTKLITKDLMNTNYDLVPVHFSDVNSTVYLNTILKYYPDNILFEYI